MNATTWKMSRKRTKKVPQYRKDVIEALRTKFTVRITRDYEKKIHIMCQKLADAEDSDEPPASTEEIYRRQAYEKIGELLNSPKKDIPKILEDITNGTVDWDSFPYEQFREKQKRDITAGTERPKVQAGGFSCRKKDCRSYETKETVWFQSQTRSGDEGMTTFVTCTVCGDTYKIY